MDYYIGTSGADSPTAVHAVPADSYIAAGGWGFAACRSNLAISVDHVGPGAGTPLLAVASYVDEDDTHQAPGCLRCCKKLALVATAV